MSFRVAVCIVGFRNREDIVQCAAALARSTHQNFDMIVCENGGAAAYQKLVESLPERLPGGQSVRVIEAPTNLGYAGGVNQCIQATRDVDAWWVLNPDTVPEPEALAELIGPLAQGECDVVGGIIYDENHRVGSYGGRWRPWLARTESLGHGQRLGAPIDEAAVLRSMNYVSGCSMLVSRRFVDHVGGMREDYFLYCEEVEWCLRGVSQGMRLGLAPKALILHKQGTTTGAGAELRQRQKLPIYLDERNKMLLTRDVFPRRVAAVGGAALILIILRFGRRRAWKQLGFALQGWAAGLRNERGIPAEFAKL